MRTFALQHGTYYGTLPPASYAVIKAAVERRVETDALRFLLEDTPSSETSTQLCPLLQDSTIAKVREYLLYHSDAPEKSHALLLQTRLKVISRHGLSAVLCSHCLVFCDSIPHCFVCYKNRQPFRNWSNWLFVTFLICVLRGRFLDLASW